MHSDRYLPPWQGHLAKESGSWVKSVIKSRMAEKHICTTRSSTSRPLETRKSDGTLTLSMLAEKVGWGNEQPMKLHLC